MIKYFTTFLTLSSILFAQRTGVQSDIRPDTVLSKELKQIVVELNLDRDFDTEDGLEQISLAVIDLTKENPVIGGVHEDNFIYPASVYKMYVAAAVLERVSKGEISLYQDYVIKFPNDVDKTKEIKNDPRPLLKDGDTVTINYLLDLMITRSDNSAANCLIDIADRKNINEMIHKYNWYGSEVTRKFLKRKYEDPGYENVKGTETCALHAVDFLYKIYTNQLVNPWVSQQMKCLLGRQLDKSKLATGLPANAMYYHKTGWYSNWTHDVGIVDDGTIKFIVACFLPIEEEKALPIMKKLSEKIFELVKNRN